MKAVYIKHGPFVYKYFISVPCESCDNETDDIRNFSSFRAVENCSKGLESEILINGEVVSELQSIEINSQYLGFVHVWPIRCIFKILPGMSNVASAWNYKLAQFSIQCGTDRLGKITSDSRRFFLFRIAQDLAGTPISRIYFVKNIFVESIKYIDEVWITGGLILESTLRSIDMSRASRCMPLCGIIVDALVTLYSKIYIIGKKIRSWLGVALKLEVERSLNHGYHAQRLKTWVQCFVFDIDFRQTWSHQRSARHDEGKVLSKKKD